MGLKSSLSSASSLSFKVKFIIHMLFPAQGSLPLLCWDTFVFSFCYQITHTIAIEVVLTSNQFQGSNYQTFSEIGHTPDTQYLPPPRSVAHWPKELLQLQCCSPRLTLLLFITSHCCNGICRFDGYHFLSFVESNRKKKAWRVYTIHGSCTPGKRKKMKRKLLTYTHKDKTEITMVQKIIR